MQATTVFSATRVHFRADVLEIPEVTVRNLQKYAASTEALGISGAIAVNCMAAEVKRVVVEAVPEADIEVLHVPVWGAFVPALNTLLGEGQRRRSRYILFQSLEVVCAPQVLGKLLDHHTSDTLVVGPVLDGHVFQAGEQPLNGRTTPWNTLALWSTQKLGLTGFLSIADGMPATEGLTGSLLGAGADATTMGSIAWWEGAGSFGGTGWQKPERGSIPAGVEEVTAVALLQHLLGESSARAVLVQLPAELERLVTWRTSWGGDEGRRRWHELKMSTKITRPAAQIEELFPQSPKARSPKARKQQQGSLAASFFPPSAKEQQKPEPEQKLTLGAVHHFGESVRPPRQVEMICLASVALFSANLAAGFSAAFDATNRAQSPKALASAAVFVGVLLGGMYLPMPLSLGLFRWVTSRADHYAGLALFAGITAFTNAWVFFVEVEGFTGHHLHCLILAARLFQGLGASILFQVRFVLVSTSTQDQHLGLQVWTFLAGDLGLGVGALLPYAATLLRNSSGALQEEAWQKSSCPSGLLLTASMGLLLWIQLAFPRRLLRLPKRVRSQALARPQWQQGEDDGAQAEKEAEKVKQQEKEGVETDSTRVMVAAKAGSCTSLAVLLISGTVRIFVQSAAMMALALWMRSAGLTGDFRQTKAVAALVLLPVPLEMLMSGGICSSSRQWLPHWRAQTGRAPALVMVALAVAMFGAASLLVASGPEFQASLVAAELELLLQALALAAPRNVLQLHEHKSADSALVLLEWLKAYIGRLMGPIFALLVYFSLGYATLFAVLCLATVFVSFTA